MMIASHGYADSLYCVADL